jgi:hypothetical protein
MRLKTVKAKMGEDIPVVTQREVYLSGLLRIVDLKRQKSPLAYQLVGSW